MKSVNKVTKGMKHREIAQWIQQEAKYAVYLGPDGHKRIIQMDLEKLTCKTISHEVLADDVWHIAEKIGDDFVLTGREADEVVQTWKKFSEPVTTPKQIAFSDYDDIAFHRLSFNRKRGVTLDDIPYTKSILDRTNDIDALCAFIGSLWHDDSHRHQFVWFHGPGGDGKSTLTAALHEIFGEAAVSVNVPESDGSARFWNTHIENKRIAIFDDAENTKFTSSGKFKALTGDKFMMIEHKGQKPYQVRNNCKFLFVSNNAPSLKTDIADFRRMIICEITPPVSPWKEMGSEFERGVRAESGDFFNYCLDTYERLCPDHDRIPVSEDQVQIQQEAADATEADFQCLLETQFRLSPSGKCAATKFTEKCRVFRLKPKDVADWLKKRHGLSMVRIHGDDGVNYYKGIVAIESGQIVG
jgi:hypothetical protein